MPISQTPPIPESLHVGAERPADFAEFWAEVKRDLASVPADWERLPGAGGETATHTVDWLRFSSLADTVVYGWLAVPKRLTHSTDNRGYLWLPGYSLGNPPPGPESLYPETLTLGLNVHGRLPDTPYSHPSRADADYIAEGIDSPQTYIYRRIVGHCLRALDVLAAQPELGAGRLIAGGMSQGGGLALIVSALMPEVTLCLADMPWLCALPLALSLLDRDKYKGRGIGRYPDARGLIADAADAHPERAAEIYRTYAYFDPLCHAPDIRCRVQMSAGGRDPSCKPPTIYAVYDALQCPKDMLFLPETGHDIVPAMHEANENWVQRMEEILPMADEIEEHIGLTQSDAFEQVRPADTETTKRLFADGGDGKEKEATLRSHHAGASSEAPASSGIPSAEKQHGEPGEAFDRQTETPMAGHVQPATQSTQ